MRANLNTKRFLSSLLTLFIVHSSFAGQPLSRLKSSIIHSARNNNFGFVIATTFCVVGTCSYLRSRQLLKRAKDLNAIAVEASHSAELRLAEAKELLHTQEQLNTEVIETLQRATHLHTDRRAPEVAPIRIIELRHMIRQILSRDNSELGESIEPRRLSDHELCIAISNLATERITYRHFAILLSQTVQRLLIATDFDQRQTILTELSDNITHELGYEITNGSISHEEVLRYLENLGNISDIHTHFEQLLHTTEESTEEEDDESGEEDHDFNNFLTADQSSLLIEGQRLLSGYERIPSDDNVVDDVTDEEDVSR